MDSVQAFHSLDLGRAIETMIAGVRQYTRAYAAFFDGPVGEDQVIGEEGVKPILKGLLMLLNSERGKLDGATADRTIREIAAAAGIELEP